MCTYMYIERQRCIHIHIHWRGRVRFHSIPFQLPYHPKVALAARLIIGLGNTNACAPSNCMYTDY